MMTNFHLNTTVVAIFPNVCLWRRSLCSDLVLTLKNRIEPPSFARTAYVVAIWPSFLFDSFGKIWATWEIFSGKWFTAPPGKKFPVRLCVFLLESQTLKKIMLWKISWRLTIKSVDSTYHFNTKSSVYCNIATSVGQERSKDRLEQFRALFAIRVDSWYIFSEFVRLSSGSGLLNCS